MNNPFKTLEQTSPSSADVSQKPEVQEKNADVRMQDVPALPSPEAPEKDISKADTTTEIKDDNGEVIGKDGTLAPNKSFFLSGVEYKTDDSGKIYCVSDKYLANVRFTIGGKTYNTDQQGKLLDNKGLDPEQQKKQIMADLRAIKYNQKYKPCENAIKKGIDGIQKTLNDGISFEKSSALYKSPEGKAGIVKITMTGNREKDFAAANAALGLDSKPEGYVWHHVDDFDIKNNTCTMQLVKIEAHTAVKPHAAACAQYDAIFGPSYNPAGKDVE